MKSGGRVGPRIYRFLWAVSMLLIGIGPWAYGEQQLTKQRLLLINSYSPQKEKGNHIISSFLREIEKKSGLSVSVEYMDSESFTDFTTWSDWLNSLFKAYGERPRAVVILGGEAWAAYRNHCPADWRDIPVILGAVKQADVDYRDKQAERITSVDQLHAMSSTFQDLQVTGYFIRDYIQENVAFILQIQPYIQNVVFFYDNRYKYHFLQKFLSDQCKEIAPVNVHYLGGDRLTTGELIDSIESLDRYNALLYAGWYTDVSHYQHANSLIYNELSRMPGRFAYEIQDFDFGNPVYLGGYFVTGREIGLDLAGLVDEVLTKGIADSPRFGPTPAKPRYHVNYRTFREAGLDESLLPEGVVWHNVDANLFERYPVRVTFISMLLVLIVVGIFFILLYRKRRMRNYIIANQKMKQFLEVMPDMAIIYSPELKIEDIINPIQELLLEFDGRDIIGCSMQELVDTYPRYSGPMQKIGKNVAYTAKTGKICSFQYDIQVGGQLFFVEAKTVPFDAKKVVCFSRDISSRIKASREINKLKNFLQLVIDHLPIGIFVKDASDHFNYLYYNQKTCDFYNREASLFIGRNDFDLEDPLADEYRREDQDVLKSDIPVTYERVFTDEAGNEKFAITTKTRLLNEDGSEYVIATLVDTTGIRKNEIDLENIRNELSIALDAGSLSAWIYDVDKQLFTSLYKETIAQGGLTYEEGIKILHPDDQEKYRVFLDDLVSGKCEKKKEILRFYRNGCYDWYETHAAGIRNAQTGQVYQLVGTEKNITAEIVKQKQLEESNFKTDLAVKSNGIVQWDYDVETRMFCAPTLDVYAPISYEDYMERVHPDDVAFWVEHFRKMFDNQADSLDIEVRMNLPGQGYRWVDIHGVALKRDKSGRLLKITGLRRDITEWKNVTEELIRLRDKAEEANRLKTAFLANMSHEIRTPLNAIVGFSNLIAHTDDPQEVQEYCRIIEANNDLLLQLINDILDLAKIEAGQLEFVYSDVDVASIFMDLEQVYRYRVKEDVQLICDLPRQNCRIRTEKNRLTQVISNFLSNACKFTFTGSIRMGFEYVGNGLRFYVSDTGKGIDRENLELVFERFTKFDSFIQGTGLGLSISKMIIDRLRGQIGVDSEFGEGSTFWVILPCQVHKIENIVPAEPGADVEMMQESKETSRTEKTILIAEDNDSNYLLLSTLLKKRRYNLLRASTGKEAVNLYRSEKPDLILMDMKMPEMDGLEATSIIRKTDARIPIIMLTANAFVEDQERALEIGCTDYLSKPVDIQQLTELLERWLG